MFTDEQMETYRSLQNGELGCPPDQDWQPPRVASISDYSRLAPYADQFGNGNVLLVGFTDPDLIDCDDCEESHVAYTAIRSDGKMSDVVTSNTVAEMMFASGLNALGAIAAGISGETPEPIIPTWDAAREVTPEEWPDTPVILTDMSDFEF